MGMANRFQNLLSGHAGHLHVGYDHVDLGLIEVGHGHDRIAQGRDRIAFLFEDGLQNQKIVFLVVDDQ